MVFELAHCRATALYLVRPLVRCFKKLAITGIVDCKYVPNHLIADGMTVLTEMRAPMVVGTNGYHVSNIVQSPAVQRDNVMGLKVEPAGGGFEALLAAKNAAKWR